MSTLTFNVRVPFRRALSVLLAVILLGLSAVRMVSAIAASSTASNAGLVTIAKGKKTVSVPAGIDLTAESKVRWYGYAARERRCSPIIARSASGQSS